MVMAYEFTNSKGVTYYLHFKDVNLSGGRVQRIYFFARDIRLDALDAVPMGYEIVETEQTAMPILKKIDEGEEEEKEEEKEKEDLKPEEFIALTVLDGKVRTVLLSHDGKYKFIDKSNHEHNIFYFNFIEDMALFDAIEELEELLNDPNTKEQNLQDFFYQHQEFILNDEYKKAHSKIVLERFTDETLIPDFVLEPFEKDALSDLLELKIPTANIFVLKKNRIRFSAAVFDACAQLREYHLYFDEEKNRSRIKEKYKLSFLKPKMFLIIGRKGKVNPIEARHAEQDVPNLVLKTYDDVLNRMKNKLQLQPCKLKKNLQ